MARLTPQEKAVRLAIKIMLGEHQNLRYYAFNSNMYYADPEKHEVFKKDAEKYAEISRAIATLEEMMSTGQYTLSIDV